MEKTILDVEKTATVLKLLGDKTRLTITSLLSYRECCVCEFVEIFDMSQPSISQHLRKLRDAGLVKEKRKGQWIFYSLNKESDTYPLIETLLANIPDQKVTLEALEANGKQITCD
ncbi:ArsR/SmtB family transcription factor [Aureibacillus halotolerans]|uniref:ArsR family transcriptional regulator n=1 Tax=Aureibacillus halotolerans TaxID=1508390 RepID=A0A4R6TSH3_9BACI|nr:metalloregulator ArsR/SmtB family transcription factor [Aureibacillus halotolerans]TDQ36251.1 ArsR family transcriptional regulator [Aureibacillus halotolerans]